MDNKEKDIEVKTVEVETDQPVGKSREPKKVTFELDIEKSLKWILIFFITLAAAIYGYKAISNLSISNPFAAKNNIAVLDLSLLRKEFNKNLATGTEPDVASKEFTTYFRKLMAVYRQNDYVVVDSSLVYSIPDSVKIVTYVDSDVLNGQLKSNHLVESAGEGSN